MRRHANDPWEQAEEEAAAAEAAAIGGRAGDEDLPPGERPLVEAGEGVAEGFELAEQDLIEAASHSDSRRNPLHDRFPSEEAADGVYGEADESEVADNDR